MITTTHPSAVERLAAALLATGLGSNLGVHRDAADLLTADPTLASDIEDGTELRLLREALPEGWDITVRTFASRWGVELWDPYYPPGRDDPPQPRYMEFGLTVAAAAKACREALEGAK